MTLGTSMKVALVHDYLVERGGAEKVLAALHQTLPDAPIYTSVHNPDTTLDVFRGADVRASFLQRLSAHPHRYRALLPLYPLAFRSFDLSAYDLIISSASGFAKGVRKAPGARHVCYCYTPPRFVWGYQDANHHERVGAAGRWGLRALRPYLARRDRVDARSVDRFLTSSKYVADRIASVYGRDATVLPPPIDCAGFTPADERIDDFLLVSRLVPYKRVDTAIEAFNRNGLPLIVVGDGRDRRRLEAMARSDRIRFLGHLPQHDVRELLASCRALIVTGEEDFGMAALEANASGRPVIAYGAGGALETVVPGVTGLTFEEQTAAALIEAVDRFQGLAFGAETLVGHARRFDTSQFQNAVRAIVHEEARLAAAPGGERVAGPLQQGEARS
ncbi:MAG: glycosyltransferase [Dehalococcoidia bacterium]